MNIQVFFFGKPGQITPREHDLLKRLRSWNVTLVPLKPGPTLEKEAALAQQKIKNSTLVVLDQHGEDLTSEQFSSWVQTRRESSTDLAFLIGSADGLSPHIQSQATKKIRFGRMVWTYDLCRLMLVEQLYRAKKIAEGGTFHRA